MKNLKIGIKIFVVLFILTGIIYPLIVTGVTQVFFKNKADGSIIYLNNKPVGSKLIGQPFESKKLFWPRPSSTQGFPYNALYSGGSNLGPTNPTLIKEVKKRVDYLRENGVKDPIPSCLVLGSASGLDPNITSKAAYAQIPRIAKYANISPSILKELVKKFTHTRLLGFLGTDMVNVVELNISLINLEKHVTK